MGAGAAAMGGGALDFQKLVEHVRKQDGVTEERALLDCSSSQVKSAGVCLTDGSHWGEASLGSISISIL